jgi:hypothetical protein
LQTLVFDQNADVVLLFGRQSGTGDIEEKPSQLLRLELGIGDAIPHLRIGGDAASRSSASDQGPSALPAEAS